ncbi:WLM-domain-containing protein [Phlegmacium glaucopus]|nr:WLM-domain-containing protein [Phlegmacium glaucopus]
MSDILVQSFAHLKDKHNADKALHLLKRIASLVKPIMRKRNWVLPSLAEFFPEDPNLHDINMGQKILLRLRPASSPDTFLPEDSLVGTMLHELTHNVHSPHDDKFYKYLSDLQDEYDALQASGYAGEGFFAEGKRVGANVSHNVPLHIARVKALEAAEKRKQISRVLGRGGRLGGQNENAGLSLRELAARKQTLWQAAERRARDDKSCASGLVAQREAEKAAKESIESKVIDLTLDDEDDHMHDSDSSSDVVIVEDVHREPPSPSTPPGPSSVPQKTSNPTGSSTSKANKVHINRDANPSSKMTIQKTSSRPQGRPEWSCQACTLLNAYTALQCEACNTHREGWTCSTCDETGISHDFWTCPWCGKMKLQS